MIEIEEVPIPTSLKVVACSAEQLYRRELQRLKQAVEAGVPVEPGRFTVRMETRTRRIRRRA